MRTKGRSASGAWTAIVGWAAASMVGWVVACGWGGGASAAEDPLAAAFLDPPPSARPAVYWVWLNGVVDHAQLTRDLEEYKAKGVSKAYIFDCGARDPAGLIPEGHAFMGPESMRAIGHALREAKRLGVEMGFTTSSSWNAGGHWVAPKHASMGLYHCEKTVRGPTRFSGVLPLPTFPKNAPKGADGLPLFLEDVAVLAVPGMDETKVISDVEAVVDLTSRVDQGRLTWDVPAGEWTIFRFVCSNNGQQLAIPSPKSQGLAIDHFSAEATRTHFQFLIDKLRQETGDLRQTALTTMYLCSYEIRGAAWTPDFVEQFKARRGYDMTRYLPVLAGATIKSQDISERFDYDFQKTQCDLLVDAFYRTARDVCRANGLLLCAEAGGPGPPTHNVPVDALKAQGAVDIPRGEFWTDQHFFVVKETACAAHIYGKRIVDQEAFTSWDHWQFGPFDLKPLADRALCDGANLFTFHMSPHNPPQAGKPGWVYHAGTHFGPSIAWWPKARALTDYLARCSHLLQQGVFVGDVCYYYGDKGYNFVPPKQVDPSLGFGYDYDVINPEAILTRLGVQGNRLVLPDGVGYEILVLPDQDDIEPDVLQKLSDLVQAGATIVGRKPTRANGLTDYPRRDMLVRQLADRMWGPCDGREVREHAYGRGKVIWGPTLRQVLRARGVGPDFAYRGRVPGADLDYVHRRTAEAEIYFVRNKNPRWEDVDCVFRVRDKAPELWMPDTGQWRRQLVYRAVPEGVQAPLGIAPSGSVFVVFRRPAEAGHIVSLRADRTSMFPAPPREPPDVPGAEIVQEPRGGAELLAWQPGAWLLETADGKSQRVEAPSVPEPVSVGGLWQVHFPPGWGAPPSTSFPKLMSWTDSSDEGVKYFSGLARYETTLAVPPDLLGPGKRLFLHLGRVAKVADVTLNDQSLGVVWKPPLLVEITEAARPGQNRLVVEVANTWSNRLVGDARSPDGKQYCRTNMQRSGKGTWKDTPLLESGLLGPVRLLPARSVPLEAPRRVRLE